MFIVVPVLAIQIDTGSGFLASKIVSYELPPVGPFATAAEADEWGKNFENASVSHERARRLYCHPQAYAVYEIDRPTSPQATLYNAVKVAVRQHSPAILG
mgnify:CR=1 FL=1